MKIITNPVNTKAIVAIFDAALRADPQLAALRALAMSGDDGAAIVRAFNDMLPPLGQFGEVGMRLATRIDGARAGEAGFLGDPAPLGAVSVAAALELALQHLGRAWAALAADALAEAGRADRGAPARLQHAEQLAAASLTIMQPLASPLMQATLREVGIIAAPLVAALTDFARAARRHRVMLREVQQQLGQPRRLRRLFARETRKRQATDATTALLAAAGRIGAIVTEAAAGAAVEAVTIDQLFMALAEGLPLPPLPDTANGDTVDG